MAGYIPIKVAAKRINRSVARVRQYVHDNAFGPQGEGWIRDEMGRLQLSEEAIAAFQPPTRGNTRAEGVKASTRLRHAKATRKLVMEMVRESDARRVCLVVVDALITSLASEKEAEEANIEATEASEGPTDEVLEPASTIDAEAIVAEEDEDFEGLLDLSDES